jgi:hypothetical protein
MRSTYKIFVGKPEGKGPLGRHRHRWESNIKVDLKEKEYQDVDWTRVAQDMTRYWVS